MILYEVNLHVQKEILADYLVWLNKHIEEILTIDGFIKAELFEEPSGSPLARFVVHYYLKDESSLNTYLEHHAPGLRADGIARFGDKFSASRRVMKLTKEFV